MYSILEFDRTVNISDIDTNIRNKFKYEWFTEKDSNNDFYSEYLYDPNFPSSPAHGQLQSTLSKVTFINE